MEETVKQRRRRKKERHRAESPDGAKPSKFWRKLTRPFRKASKALLPSGAGSHKREEEKPRSASSAGKRLPKLAILLPALGAGILLSVYLRSCNSTEVVIEENTETLQVRQMMNEVLQQQQQNDINSGMIQGAAPATPTSAVPPTEIPPTTP